MGLKYHNGTKFREVAPVEITYAANGVGARSAIERDIRDVPDPSVGIAPQAFNVFESLTRVRLPEDLTGGIGDSAFNGCTVHINTVCTCCYDNKTC